MIKKVTTWKQLSRLHPSETQHRHLPRIIYTLSELHLRSFLTDHPYLHKLLLLPTIHSFLSSSNQVRKIFSPSTKEHRSSNVCMEPGQLRNISVFSSSRAFLSWWCFGGVFKLHKLTHLLSCKMSITYRCNCDGKQLSNVKLFVHFLNETSAIFEQ